MFGTLGFSELIIILVIVLIIFGAGRLPQIGEGVGKALKGFKKEVQEMPPPLDEGTNTASSTPPSQEPQATANAAAPSSTTPATSESPSYQPGPEQTPGTTAALAYSGIRPQQAQPVASHQPLSAPELHTQETVSTDGVPGPVTMEERAAMPTPQGQAQYPPLPPSARPQPMTKRPSAIVNKEAVARVQAQRAAKQAQASPQDMQSLGEGLGSALKTFRQAASDVKNSIDPEMRTIQAELESAQKEMEDTVDVAKQPLLPKDPSSSA